MMPGVVLSEQSSSRASDVRVDLHFSASMHPSHFTCGPSLSSITVKDPYTHPLFRTLHTPHSVSLSLCITPISSRSLPSSFFYPFMLHHLSYFQTQIYETNHSAPSLSLPLFLSLSITPPLISVNR